MADLTIVYWRDIPAQVIVGKGRKAAKLPLPERFEKAIDRAAMRSGAIGPDEYLADWRKVAGVSTAAGADMDVARAEADRLDGEYDRDRLNALVDKLGWA